MTSGRAGIVQRGVGMVSCSSWHREMRTRDGGAAPACSKAGKFYSLFSVEHYPPQHPSKPPNNKNDSSEASDENERIIMVTYKEFKPLPKERT